MVLLSPHWYRVSGLRPRLRAGVRIARHQVRGETWVVLTDPVSGQHHRFDGNAWALLAGCDGKRTLDEIWAVRAQADVAPTQDQTLRLVGQAFAANLLLGDIPPEAAAVMRGRQRERAQRRRAAVNPLAFRVPLWDPDAFLGRHARACGWLFGRTALWALVGALLVALAVLVVQGESFARHAEQLAGSTRLWLLAWLLYPLLKAVHELAHAFAVKHFGGEVHAIGVTLLLLTPVPYVDASAAAAFADKRKRAVVAAAGIGAELALAALALVLWVLLQPGWTRDIAAAVVLIGGVSTLLINANPLLRFDGYHVASDLLELPNLASRSALWWRTALRRLLGARTALMPHIAPGERGWLVAYAPLSLVMQALLMAAAVLVAAQWSGWLAAALALISIWMMLLAPLLRGLWWVLCAAELHGTRARALTVSLAAITAAAALFTGLPVPDRSHAPGLVWLPDDAFVRCRSEGFVEAFRAADGQWVQAGAVIAVLSNDGLLARLKVVQAELEHARIEQVLRFAADALGSSQAADRIAQLEAERGELEQRREALQVRAQRAGRLVLDPQRQRVGMFMSQGQLLAQVLPGGVPLVRAFVANDDIARVNATGTRASVTLAQGGGDWPARPSRQGPGAGGGAHRALPSAALGEPAGGSIAIDPSDTSGRTAAEPRLELELHLPDGTPATIGARVLVTFDHGSSGFIDLAAQALRRLFLRQLGS